MIHDVKPWGALRAAPGRLYGEDMPKPVLLYELDAVVTDDLSPHLSAIAEDLDRDRKSIERALSASGPRYAGGEISQSLHWEDAAFKLGLDSTDVFEAYSLNTAVTDREILGRIRAQAPAAVIGLISDATPDWVGHWRQVHQLDRLVSASVIGSELDTELTYPQLLRLAAERLQTKPEQIWFVARKAEHIGHAKAVGMKTIDLRSGDYRALFAPIGL